MRYDKSHREASRRRIVDAAAKRFRTDGVAASGIAGVMSDAGMTNGAFYVHFDSKEALVREVLCTTLDERRDEILRAVDARPTGLEAAIRDYLSPAHRDRPGAGCPTASLVPEIARQARPTRVAYTARLKEFIGLVAALVPDADETIRRQRATALFGLLVGTLQMARAVTDKEMSNSILEGGVAAAIAMVATPPQSA